MASIRIGLVNHVGEIGGAEISLLNHLATLDRNLFEPLLISPPGALWSRAAELGVRSAEIPTSPTWLWPMDRTKVPLLLSSVRACLRAGTELLHANSVSAGIVTGLIALTHGVPTVAHVRDLVVEPPSHYHWLNRLLGCNNRVIAVSGAVERRLWEVGVPRRRTTVIHNGVNISMFVPGDGSGQALRRELGIGTVPLVGIIGQVIPWKGHTEFLEAAARVVVRRPEVHFLVVGSTAFGSDSYVTELQELAKRLHVADRFHWLGFRRDMPAVMDALDLLVSASWGEPFGRTLIEAGAMAKPVVATAVGGAPEIVLHRETGILVPPKDPERLADAIVQIIANPGLGAEMGTRGRKRVEASFDIRVTTARIQEVYADLLGRKAGR